ncbi:E3 ubiquitin-protein ligase RBBP6 [Eumeta japonica]|uniref:E3 ubiquitin-protein ligase RBBP6 n=1 Tax=Eumeta variegata TaxID=151549 RepID=A0A4C1VU09_EUMVA|nr:E3 ubiquitin-protein ligase RBBP6 [Eumeta japonica]
MSVHYKFKSALDYDTVTFDGLHISVGDLKAAISQQKRIGKTSDFDLQITNAQTKEVYTDDTTLIPKNTSLLVARIPLSQQPKKQWEGLNNASLVHKDVTVNKGLADLSRMEGSEQDKINAMISQSTFDYDPSKGQSQRGIVPSNYICYKCQKHGHWIKDCPLANAQGGESVEIRRSTGIPRSFMVPVDGPKAPGAMMTPSGTFAVPVVDHEAYLASENAGGGDGVPVSNAPEPTIPDELICSLCRDLLTDAVMIPCCGNSFCDELSAAQLITQEECMVIWIKFIHKGGSAVLVLFYGLPGIRGALLESEDHECPDCREKEISPGTLIPNRFLRNSVSAFRNQTGYSRRTPHRPAALPQPKLAQVNGSPGGALSLHHPTTSSINRLPSPSAHSFLHQISYSYPRDRHCTEHAPVIAPHLPPNGQSAAPIASSGVRRPGPGEESDGSQDDNITVTVPPCARRPRDHRRAYGIANQTSLMPL